MENMTRIIIDTDIGDDIDDAYAIALAVKMQKFDILGVTTVYRNSEQRAKIASALLMALGRSDVGVYAGRDYPYKEKFRIEDFEETLPDGRPVIPHYFEEFGSAPVRSQGAAEFIAEQAEKFPGEIVVVAIGPLTNLAEVCQKYPAAFAKLDRIVCMGGAFSGEKAEWNIRCDPEAAAAVLGSGVPISFVGLDVTAHTYLNGKDVQEVTSGKGEAFGLLNKMLGKWMDSHPGRNPTMHDALTVAEVVGGFCRYDERRIEIPLEGNERACTCTTQDPSAPLVVCAVSVDRPAFMHFFKGTLLQPVMI